MWDVINLKTTFGDRFKISYEESYYAEYGDNAKVEDPFYYIIPCRFGHLFAFRTDEVGAMTDKRGAISDRLLSLSCIIPEHTVDAEDGVIVVFHPDDIDEIAQVIRPHRKRQWTEEQRQAVAERLARHQFKPQKAKDKVGKTCCKSPSPDAPGVESPVGGAMGDLQQKNGSGNLMNQGLKNENAPSGKDGAFVES